MWVLLIVSQMLNNPIKFSKQAMMSFNIWPEGILMCLPNNFFNLLTHHKQCEHIFLLLMHLNWVNWPYA
jgi:hypothetical protein